MKRSLKPGVLQRRRVLLTLMLMLLFGVPVSSADLYLVTLTYDGDPPHDQTSNHFEFSSDNVVGVFQQGSADVFGKIHVTSQKGNAANRKALADKPWEIQRKAKPEDVLVFYYGSHGGTSRKDGWRAGCSDGAIYGGQLREGFGRMPCHVIAAISTCGSGGFGGPGAEEHPVPGNLTALCVCRRRKSTGSQMDIALCEALIGFADRDRSGEITREEVINYLPKRYREMMTDKEQSQNPVELMPVIVPATDKSAEVVLARPKPDRMAVVTDGDGRGAVSVGSEGKKHKVRFLGWARREMGTGYSMPDELVGPNHIVKPEGFPPAEYKSPERWIPAIVLSEDGKSFEISVPGQSRKEPPNVAPSKLRPMFCSQAFETNRSAGISRLLNSVVQSQRAALPKDGHGELQSSFSFFENGRIFSPVIKPKRKGYS